MRMSTTRGTAIAAATACGLLLAGCGSSSKSSTGTSTPATSAPAAAVTSAAAPAAGASSFCSEIPTLEGQLAGGVPSAANGQKIYNSIYPTAPDAVKGDISQIFGAYKKDGTKVTTDPDYIKAETDITTYIVKNCAGSFGAGLPTSLPSS
jgi:hypothetical protein